jgi:sodium/bile acid cotransporter 7
MDRGQQRLLNQKVAEINAKFPGVRTMTPAEVKQLERQGQRIVFVDCRTAPEMAVSRIHPNAISEDECIHRIDSIKNSEPPALVVGYCTIGYRSAKFVQKMKRSAGLGDADIVNLSGSILQWMQDSYDLWDATGSRTDRVHVWGKEYCQYVPEQGPNEYKSEYFKNPILATVFPQVGLFTRNSHE